MKKFSLPIVAVIGGMIFGTTGNAEGAEPPDGFPNVVLIMTDNHGAWTLGCYGNPTFGPRTSIVWQVKGYCLKGRLRRTPFVRPRERRF